MTDTARPSVYSTGQMAAHWLVAFLVLFQFLTGGAMELAFGLRAEGGPILSGPAVVHGGLGLSILALMIWRFTMRFRHGTPPPPDSEPTALQYVSRGTHYAFYVILIGMPLAGVAALLTGNEWIAATHALASKLLIVLAALHIAGAFWHIFKGDGVIRRMARGEPARIR